LEENTVKCVKCLEDKPQELFYLRKKGLRRRECKSCFDKKNRQWRVNHRPEQRERSRRQYHENPEYWRNRGLKNRYGITFEEFKEMLEKQDGKCLICGKKPTTKLHVDHCHNTKKVRGLLCGNCNRMIGIAQHDIGILASAIKYLS
jgi:tRNA(Ile)-lysidine synthase TilS/MesJ